MAGIFAGREQYDKALPMYAQALEIIKSSGSLKEKESTLSKMAVIYVKQGRFRESLGFYQQLREIKRKIGDAKGETETVALMSKLSVAMLKDLSKPDAGKIRKFAVKSM